MKHPVRIAIIGMGGFAGSHHNAVARLEERGKAKLEQQRNDEGTVAEVIDFPAAEIDQ